jgi:hypothetical protein
MPPLSPGILAAQRAMLEGPPASAWVNEKWNQARSAEELKEGRRGRRKNQVNRGSPASLEAAEEGERGVSGSRQGNPYNSNSFLCRLSDTSSRR